MKRFYPRFNQRTGTPHSDLKPNPVRSYASCNCLIRQGEGGTWRELRLHSDIQNTNSDAWKSLEAYIQSVAAEGKDELNPLDGIGPEKWQQIVTLPRSIATLPSVKFLSLYGSHLVRIPPEIGEMKNLEEFEPYTSYRLHWFPYEIIRCKKLKISRVSTRALYGNYKYRAPFPRLPGILPDLIPQSCGICRGPFREGRPHQAWISLWVATDVLPLLVHACSHEYIEQLPQPPVGYVQKPHQGGPGLQQPPARYSMNRRNHSLGWIQ